MHHQDDEDSIIFILLLKIRLNGNLYISELNEFMLKLELVIKFKWDLRLKLGMELEAHD